MRAAMMATGGIGGFLGVKLANIGWEIAAIARGAHLEAIGARGLTLRGAAGEETAQPWRATADPAEVGPVDYVIFGVKGDALPAAAEACRPLLGPETVVIPFLNGVEAADRLAEILPAAHVADGVARVSTTIAEPGVIAQTGDFATFQFAERDNRASPRIERLRAALAEAGVKAPEVDDISVEIWRKFVLFSAMSGVTAAGRCRIGHVRAHPPLARLARAVMTETTALARARGVALDADIVERMWDAVEDLPAEARASTAVDIEHGRPIEVEWVTGAVLRLSAAAGLQAPANEAIYALLSPHRHGRPA